jgi:signal transduction histidine kinase
MRIEAPTWEHFKESRIKLGFFVALVMLLSFATVTLLGFRDAADSNEVAEKTYGQINRLESEFTTINGLESAQRGYLLSGEATFLNRYRQLNRQILAEEDEIRSLTSSNSFESTNADLLSELVAKKIAVMDQGIRVRSLIPRGTKSAPFQLNVGLGLIDQIRAQLTSMESYEHRQLDDRLKSTKKRVTYALVFFGATTIFAVLLLAGVLSLMIRVVQSFAVTRERQLSYSNQLEQEVSRTAAVRKELERSNRELQDFAFVASHDLQEPLRKIRSYGDRIKTRLSENLDPISEQDLGRMLNAAERMQGLINDILALSRVSSKPQAFVPTNLNTVLDEVLDDLEIKMQQSRAIVKREPLPTIEADPVQMRQLFQNLLGNALKFIRPDSSAELSVLNMPTTLPGTIGIAFGDNGIGFDDKHAEKIFTVFQRLNTRSEYEGSGVGLAICRRIVERHGGQIEAKGVVGQGAIFTVVLPKVHRKA